MKIAYIGKQSEMIKTLGRGFICEPIDKVENDKLEDYKVILFNPDGFNEYPKIDIPDSSRLFNLYEIDNMTLSVYSHLSSNEKLQNFIVEYPGMSHSFLSKTMEAMLLDMPMTPIALGLEDSKLTKFEMSNLSQKQECLTTFDKDLKDLSLERKDHLTVRKLWELGLETIAIQTIIELDGDVTTRIQPQYSTDDNATLHKLHHSSVDLSYNYWLSLIKLIGEVFNTVLKNVFKPG